MLYVFYNKFMKLQLRLLRLLTLYADINNKVKGIVNLQFVSWRFLHGR